MSERIDLAMLEAVASTGVSLLLVGPCQPKFDLSKLHRLLEFPNVQRVGEKSFDEMPSYHRVIDVGLTPYAQSDFNSASFPLKTLEYLAAGRPVVASDLPAHRWLDTPHVKIVRTPEECASQTRILLDAPRTAQAMSSRRAFAAGHSWEVRTSEIVQLLDLDGRTQAVS
jgi:teichuronic acid biosynthesis glycosyltransferase TuaH